MATESTYKFKGASKRIGDKTSRLIIEGSLNDPKLYLDRDGDAVALTDEQVEAARKDGWKLVKTGEEETDDKSETPAPASAGTKTTTPAAGSTAGTRS